MSTTAPRSTRRLTDAQLEEMLALGMDPPDAQIRQVFVFDTPDLRLNKSGVVVRARRVQGRGDVTVIKLRPIVPASCPSRRGRCVTSRRRNELGTT